MGVGIGGVNPLPAGTEGTLWYYSPQSGVRNFPKKLTFLRLSIFLQFLSNFIPKKIDIFLYPPLLTSKRQVEKIFPENFQILFTLLKNNFQFYFFCFINETPKKIFQKIFKNSQVPYRNGRSKNYRKKLKIVFLLIFILCNVTQNYHNRKSV